MSWGCKMDRQIAACLNACITRDHVIQEIKAILEDRFAPVTVTDMAIRVSLDDPGGWEIGITALWNEMHRMHRRHNEREQERLLKRLGLNLMRKEGDDE
jgi:hypothetical protein